MMRRAFAIALGAAVGAAACAPSTPDVAALGDYTRWKRIDTYGPAPGHRDTYRVIYVNDVARQYAGGLYPDGSILVKEIYSNEGGAPGALGEIDIMRQRGGTAGRDYQAGWLFTETSTPGGTEVEKTTCFRRCHVSAPYAGAWMNYGD